MTMLLNRTKLKYVAMEIQAYEKLIWMIKVGAIFLLRLKGAF